MKVRIGFVSNSSSSSYVVIVPKSFNIKKVDWEEHLKRYTDVTKEEVIELFNLLKKSTHLWPSYEQYASDVKNIRAYDVLCSILYPYAVVSFQGSPDDPGQLKLLTAKTIKKFTKEKVI